ncbi:hypothetical protein NK6_5087 [Bradyrhizobium diazoefficiens]|uniref:Uncharacterized protein n=1 Tax=Bradyrhizobium diazoefficiens TaxID=1355477 RepID=A0A0E4BQK6_9BRAD|nr:hypothetical protein NK6_5087 [Bradyrhizobium diazoefficiens]
MWFWQGTLLGLAGDAGIFILLSANSACQLVPAVTCEMEHVDVV